MDPETTSIFEQMRDAGIFTPDRLSPAAFGMPTLPLAPNPLAAYPQARQPDEGWGEFLYRQSPELLNALAAAGRARLPLGPPRLPSIPTPGLPPTPPTAPTWGPPTVPPPELPFGWSPPPPKPYEGYFPRFLQD